MIRRFAALAALFISPLLAQTTSPAPADATPSASAEASSVVPELQPDMNDPAVIRAQQDITTTEQLVRAGAVPILRLRAAKERLEDAKDMSILKKSLYASDLLPEQADQMVQVANRLVLRRQKSLIEMQQMVNSGIISRAEADFSGADYARAQTELQLAQTRARLITEMAASVKLEKSIAVLEVEVERHPDWNGKVYTKYDGSGVFTPADMERISLAFRTHFAKAIPISADGATATHRSMGFDHRGRVDVAVNPDTPEGVWLRNYLERNRIPYFAFRAAVPHMATGAHIHIGPQSTKLEISN